MIKTLFDLLLFVAIMWSVGLVFVLLVYGMGGSGSDVLSNHYRNIISLFI